jgi:hypothetical protein
MQIFPPQICQVLLTDLLGLGPLGAQQEGKLKRQGHSTVFFTTLLHVLNGTVTTSLAPFVILAGVSSHEDASEDRAGA